MMGGLTNKTMTQEEKQELLVALCGYLPYDTDTRVKIGDYSDYIIIGCNVKKGIVTVKITNDTARSKIDINYEYVKPYLRPMSSMTEEEKKMLWEELDKDTDIICENLDAPIVNIYNGRMYRGNPIHHEIDFLNKNHFDWRGLIPMGLALEAPEDMYK